MPFKFLQYATSIAKAYLQLNSLSHARWELKRSHTMKNNYETLTYIYTAVH